MSVRLENQSVVFRLELFAVTYKKLPCQLSIDKIRDFLFFDQLVFEKPYEHEPVNRSLDGFCQLFSVQILVRLLESLRETLAVAVELGKERFIDGLHFANAYRRFPLRSPERRCMFFNRSACNGFMRE